MIGYEQLCDVSPLLRKYLTAETEILLVKPDSFQCHSPLLINCVQIILLIQKDIYKKYVAYLNYDSF